MQKNLFFLILASFLSLQMSAQTKPAYQLFDGNGKKVTYQYLVTNIAKKNIIFFGEQHNNVIAHWLELQITKDIFAEKKGNLMLGAEMFEADGQTIFDEFLEGKIPEKNFEKEMRLWDNYKTDYKPMVQFAVEKNLKFVATNIPRRYANLVFREGLDGLNSLSAEAKKWIVPLPIEVDYKLHTYQEMLGGEDNAHTKEDLKFPSAQAIKDATMAHFILKNYKKEVTFIHFNGAFHTDFQEGIVWYVKKKRSDLTVTNITTISQDNIEQLDEKELGRADFYLVVPTDMTTTY